MTDDHSAPDELLDEETTAGDVAPVDGADSGEPAISEAPSDEADADAASDLEMDWYILKVAFNREDSIAEALRKKIALEGMDEFFEDIVVPSEDVATFTRDGKKRSTKRKLLPGYIMVRMTINDDTWFLVRETGGISDFTGSAGKPMPMDPPVGDRMAVFTPITSPSVLKRGPPELPRLMAASVWM